MNLLEGLKIEDGYVLYIYMSLSGLKQFVFEWSDTCHKRLVKMGFKRLVSDLCVYYSVKDDAIIELYVDDLLILVFKDG